MFVTGMTTQTNKQKISNRGGEMIYTLTNTENKTFMVTSNSNNKYFIKINQRNERTGKEELIVKHTISVFDKTILKTRLLSLDRINESLLDGLILLESKRVRIYLDTDMNSRYTFVVQFIVDDNIRRTDRFLVTNNIRNYKTNKAIPVPIHNILKALALSL